MTACASEQDIPFLKQLWKERFADSEEYIADYFNTLFDRITVVVKRQAGVPISMVSMLPVTLSTPQGSCRGHYIYAAATAKAQEGRGCMSELLEEACRLATARGDCFSCLIPATPRLFSFYQKRLYQTISYKNMKFISFSELSPVGSSLAPLSILDEEAFFTRRERFLQSRSAVLRFDCDCLSYWYRELQRSADVAVGIGGKDYAVCNAEEDLLTVKETSLLEETLYRCLPTLLERFGCRKAKLFFPSAENSSDPAVIPYGMLRRLPAFPASLNTTRPYMGLMMD